MRPGASSLWVVVSSVALAVAAWLVLPRFAAGVVRTAIETDSARDRAAFAAGASPWAWRFHDAEDVVAGRAFGAGRLRVGDGAPDGRSGRFGKTGSVTEAVDIQATGPEGFEVGLPLYRQADLARMTILRLDASATAVGRYGLAIRETLSAPGLRADLGAMDAADLNRPIDLRRLVWTDESGDTVTPPSRAAMLRLSAKLPLGETLVLRGAALTPPPGFALAAPLSMPWGLTAEALLARRDAQRASDPLVTFGHRSAPATVGLWKPWAVPAAYLALILLATLSRRTASRGTEDAATDTPESEAHLPSSLQRQRLGAFNPATETESPLRDAFLSLAGPLWFIVSLGLSQRPSAAGVTTFAIGIAYALLLSTRHRLPRWHVLGAWRHAGWPLLAIVVAAVLVAAVGHAPVWPPVGRVLIYVAWAFFQQWLMLAVAGSLLARVLPRPLAVVLTALAFALLHTPNGLLMQLCFLAELGWAGWYLHRRALLPVAVAHAASAVLLQACLTGGLLRSLEVSARFLG